MILPILFEVVAKHIELLMETASINQAENSSDEDPIAPKTDNEKAPVQPTNTTISVRKSTNSPFTI